MLSVKIKRLHPAAILPTYAHGPDEDAGMDLYAAEPIFLRPNEPALVRTGLAIELPPGYEAQIRPRSGLAAKHGITVPNAPGTVDPSYRGEVKVILLWVTTPASGKSFVISQGDRIAQMVVARYEPVQLEWAEDLGETLRSQGGFGSSGR